MEKGKKAVVFTLGCKVNGSESDSLIKGLKDRGYETFDELVPADLYIVNTCAVTGEAEKKSRQMVARIKKLNENATIIFTGCAVQKDPSAFSQKENVSVITGALNKGKILELLEEKGAFIDEDVKEYDELLFPDTLRTRTYVKVQDGCNNFCSYCIIPYLRKRSRSRNPKSVLDEIEKIKSKEVIINGINLSAYDFNGTDLTGLMEGLKGVDKRIRLGSLEVNVITDKFLQALKGLKNFAEHFHLSLQSGSDAVLKSMNRHYTAEEFKEKVDLIRKYFPTSAITTDIIVGFPTESEEDFEKTLTLASEVEFSDIHCFPYSKRSGTASYKLKDLDKSIKKERLNRLLKLKTELKNSFIQKNIGKEADLLLEEFSDGYSEGYSGNYIRLYLKGEYVNEFKKVIIKEKFKDGALCEVK